MRIYKEFFYLSTVTSDFSEAIMYGCHKVGTTSYDKSLVIKGFEVIKEIKRKV